jgi:hypothetical protein
MPIRLRIASTSTSGSVISSPSTKIWPDVGCSRRLTHFSRVDFPEPDGPMTLSVVDVEVDALEDLVVAEVLVQLDHVDRRTLPGLSHMRRHQRALPARASMRRTTIDSGTVIRR